MTKCESRRNLQTRAWVQGPRVGVFMLTNGVGFTRLHRPTVSRNLLGVLHVSNELRTFFFWPWAFMYLRLSDLDEKGWASQKKIVKVEYVPVQGERADARVYDHNTTRVGIGSHHGGGTPFLILGRFESIWPDHWTAAGRCCDWD